MSSSPSTSTPTWPAASRGLRESGRRTRSPGRRVQPPPMPRSPCTCYHETRSPCVCHACAVHVPCVRRACATLALQVPLLRPGAPSTFVADFATPPGTAKEGRRAQPVQATALPPKNAQQPRATPSLTLAPIPSSSPKPQPHFHPRPHPCPRLHPHPNLTLAQLSPLHLPSPSPSPSPLPPP